MPRSSSQAAHGALGDALVPEIPGSLEAGEGRENLAVEGDQAAGQVVGEMQTGGVRRRWSGHSGQGWTQGRTRGQPGQEWTPGDSLADEYEQTLREPWEGLHVLQCPDRGWEEQSALRVMVRLLAVGPQAAGSAGALVDPEAQ